MAEKKILTDEDDALLKELGIDIESRKVARFTAREERIIGGFEEIQKFVEEKGRLPQHGEDKDIFERLFAVRLDQIRNQQECVSLLQHMDYQNLLDGSYKPEADIPDEMDDDELKHWD